MSNCQLILRWLETQPATGWGAERRGRRRRGARGLPSPRLSQSSRPWRCSRDTRLSPPFPQAGNICLIPRETTSRARLCILVLGPAVLVNSFPSLGSEG